MRRIYMCVLCEYYSKAQKEYICVQSNAREQQQQKWQECKKVRGRDKIASILFHIVKHKINPHHKNSSVIFSLIIESLSM